MPLFLGKGKKHSHIALSLMMAASSDIWGLKVTNHLSSRLYSFLIAMR
jgi:hypothetical protein